MDQPMTLGRFFGAAVAMVVALALLAPAAQATEPVPGYGQFAGCPSPEENPAVAACFRSEINGGHFQIGKKDVPIKNPMTLSGGYTDEGDFFANSKGGLTRVRQQVPGGIIGLTGLDWLIEYLGLKDLKLFATTELAGTPDFVFHDPFKLPVKVHLENRILGDNCYVGSDSNPIDLRLTTHTTNPPPPNKPISGNAPEFNFDFATGIIHLDNGVLVDNSFAAPGVTGCQLNLGFIHINIDDLVNEQSGLPSPAGTNETVQESDAEIVLAERVYP